MADTTFLALLVSSILQLLHGLCQELGEDTCRHMRHHAQQLSQPVARLLQDMERSALAWADLLFAALQHWQVWAFAGIGVLVLLIFRLCRRISQRSRQTAGSDDEDSSSSSSTERGDQRWQGEGSGDSERRLFGCVAKRIRSSVQHLAYRSREVEELVGDLLAILQDRLSSSFFPVLQPAIGVGSAFEGWSPRGRQAVYRLLVPLRPPRGHVFHLELGTAAEVSLAKDGRVRVELACTCRRDKLLENIPFYLQHPHEEEMRRDPAGSLLSTLCTGSYLDVHKTAQWFQNLVSSAWQEMPQARRYTIKLLPSSRSCKLQLTNAFGKSLLVDIVFGVRHGDSDIFLSSQETTEAVHTPSTTWAESYAVAEVKFFRHVARQAPHDASHLKCLQLFAAILLGTGFSTSTFKTAAMHLLNTLPVSSWSSNELLMRLQDILCYLRGCLHDKRLDHFFFANDNMPEDIVLPPALQTAQPPNLFHRLLHNPAAHAKAMRDAEELQERLTSLLFSGHRKSSSRTQLS